MNEFETDAATRVEGFALPALAPEAAETRATDALVGAWMRAVAAGNESVADALATLIRRSR